AELLDLRVRAGEGRQLLLAHRGFGLHRGLLNDLLGRRRRRCRLLGVRLRNDEEHQREREDDGEDRGAVSSFHSVTPCVCATLRNAGRCSAGARSAGTLQGNAGTTPGQSSQNVVTYTF